MARSKNEAPKSIILSVTKLEAVPTDSDGKRTRRGMLKVKDSDGIITADREKIGHDPKNHYRYIVTKEHSVDSTIGHKIGPWNSKGKYFTLAATADFDYEVTFAAAVEAKADSEPEAATAAETQSDTELLLEA